MTFWRISSSGSGAQLVDAELFHILIELEIRKARRLHYPVSLICIAPDLPADAGVLPLRRLAETALPVLRATDAVAPYGSHLGVLLVDAETTNLPTIRSRLIENMPTTRWSAGGACYPTTAGGMDELQRQASEMMIRAKQEGLDKLYLAS